MLFISTQYCYSDISKGLVSCIANKVKFDWSGLDGDLFRNLTCIPSVCALISGRLNAKNDQPYKAIVFRRPTTTKYNADGRHRLSYLAALVHPEYNRQITPSLRYMTLGSYKFTSGNKRLTIWYNIPKNIKKDSAVVFVMHGVKRNGKDYRNDWIKYSNDKKFILLVPEFSNKEFPESSNYNLANIANSNGKINPRKDWHFDIIEEVFKDIKLKLKLETKKYYLYGHSAGAQFVHRFVMFYPDSSLKLAISANAGWYTFPDSSINFPYGLHGLNFKKDDFKQIFSEKMIILLGKKDTDPNHKYLRKTKEATEQGKHRFERGNNYFKFARNISSKRKLEFNWKIKHIDGVGHSNSGMSKEAIKLIR